MNTQTFDSSFSIDQTWFFINGSQNFLIFQLIFNFFAMSAGHTGTIIAWKSKVLSNEIIKLPNTVNFSQSRKLKWHNSKMKEEFKGCCLKQKHFYSKKDNKFIYCLWIG